MKKKDLGKYLELQIESYKGMKKVMAMIPIDSLLNILEYVLYELGIKKKKKKNN